MRWRGGERDNQRRSRGALGAALSVVMLVAAGLVAPAAMANGGGESASTCVGFWDHLSYDGATPDAHTVAIAPVDAVIESITIDLADFAHPEPMSEPGERVTVSLGDLVIGTTPDLADDETRRQFTFSVGRQVTFEQITITHAPISVPDDLFVKTVCYTIGESPTTTSTSTTSTTTSTSTTSTVPDGSTTTTTSTSTTTSVPDGSTTTSTSTTTSVPDGSTTTSTSTTSTVPDGSTTTTPTATVAPPTTIPGQGSYVADCASGTTEANGFVWTAAGSVPDTVVPGEPLTITSQAWQVAVPASVLENARQAGLIDIGDTFEVVVGATIAASDTVEGEQSQNGIVTTLTVTDAGDGTAAAAQVVVAADDMTFTPTGDRVAFRLAAGSILMRIGPDVEVSCGFDVEQPPIVVTPPGEIAGPPELAVTGPSPLLVAGIVVFVLLDVGYLAWSATRPRRAAAL